MLYKSFTYLLTYISRYRMTFSPLSYLWMLNCFLFLKKIVVLNFICMYDWQSWCLYGFVSMLPVCHVMWHWLWLARNASLYAYAMRDLAIGSMSVCPSHGVTKYWVKTNELRITCFSALDSRAVVAFWDQLVYLGLQGNTCCEGFKQDWVGENGKKCEFSPNKSLRLRYWKS